MYWKFQEFIYMYLLPENILILWLKKDLFQIRVNFILE